MSTLLAQPAQPQTQSTSSAAPARYRIPTLDGWRGIAILLVLFDHVQAAFLSGYLRPWTQLGQHGVTIFFVLSGYLITSKLIEGPIDLHRFYLRRFFRLMPAAWAYLACVWIFGLLARQHWLSLREILSCLFFYRNFMGFDLSNVASHFWSLSLEEQFYLVWPCLLAFLGTRWCKWIAIVGALGCSYYRLAHWGYYDHQWFNFHTQVRADALLIGCLLGLALGKAQIRAAIVRWSRWWWAPASGGLGYFVLRFHSLPTLCEALCIAGLIASSTLHADFAFFKWLNSAPLVYLGALSYSIYVWQQFFFIYRGASVTLVMICLMPFFAVASYYLIEKPMIAVGRKLEKPHTTLT